MVIHTYILHSNAYILYNNASLRHGRKTLIRLASESALFSLDPGLK